MGLYTAEGLVKHAEKAYRLPTKYMWGGILRPITNDYINMLRNIYGNHSGTGYTSVRWAELQALVGKGYYGCDCIGLIKSYYWSGKPDGGTGSPKYGAAGFPDVNATMMFNKAERKGKISTLPEKPGVIVYSRSHPHVGIYVGNGLTIESTLGSRGDGVVKRKLDNFWEYWFECPYIEYKSSTVTTAKTKKCTLAFSANVRKEPKESSEKLGAYKPGDTVTIVNGTEAKDMATGYVYVKVAGESGGWIVKSAIK